MIGVAPEPCRIEIGTDMSPSLYGWINDSLASKPRAHQVRLVRNDVASAYALNLTDTMLSEFTIPQIDASDPATIRPMALTLRAAAIRRQRHGHVERARSREEMRLVTDRRRRGHPRPRSVTCR